jgi:hypothetical protein
MTYTRPHEDRLGTGGSAADQVLLRTGTGTAAWGAGPGITPHVIYAECNAPSATVAENPLPFDTYYDETQAVISGAPLTAALAALNLTLSGNVFTATDIGIYHLELSFTPRTAPALQGSEIFFFTSGYLAEPFVAWGVWTGGTDNNPPGRQNISFSVWLDIGDTFRVATGTNGTVTLGVITYASMSIMRVV